MSRTVEEITGVSTLAGDVAAEICGHNLVRNAAKDDDVLCDFHGFVQEQLERLAAAQASPSQPTAQPVAAGDLCPACEGTPKAPNSPCVLCGKWAAPPSPAADDAQMRERAFEIVRRCSYQQESDDNTDATANHVVDALASAGLLASPGQVERLTRERDEAQAAEEGYGPLIADANARATRAESPWQEIGTAACAHYDAHANRCLHAERNWSTVEGRDSPRCIGCPAAISAHTPSRERVR